MSCLCFKLRVHLEILSKLCFNHSEQLLHSVYHFEMSSVYLYFRFFFFLLFFFAAFYICCIRLFATSQKGYSAFGSTTPVFTVSNILSYRSRISILSFYTCLSISPFPSHVLSILLMPSVSMVLLLSETDSLLGL